MADNSFSLLTYNVAFHLPLEKERTDALVGLIENLNPSVICLQELTKTMFTVLLKNLGSKYQCNRDSLPYKYGIAIFLENSYQLINSEIIDFESFQGRELNWIVTKINGNEITFATTHLESEFPNQNFKYPQFKQMFAELANHLIAVICGDVNIIEEDEPMFVPPDNWKDVWLLDGADQDKKFTLDKQKNEFVDGSYRTRLDRIYVNSDRFYIDKLNLVKGEYKTNHWISDHFGYFVEFSIT